MKKFKENSLKKYIILIYSKILLYIESDSIKKCSILTF